MKKIISIVQYGLGNVGKKLIELAGKLNSDELEIKYIGVSEIGFSFFDPDGLDMDSIIRAKDNNSIDALNIEKIESSMLLTKVNDSKISSCTIVDVTASSSTYPTLIQALESGFNAVMANKKPLAGTYNDFERLTSAAKKHNSKLMFGCNVGGGLPIIYIIQSLVKTNDTIIEIKGCFSGTLGYIFSELEKGQKFSSIIKKAKELGYTEPDTREDLSGMDVARKALILARMQGYKLEIEDCIVESLVPEELRDCRIVEFFEKIKNYDVLYYEKFKKAKENGNTLRYVASITGGLVKISLDEVPLTSPIGRLNGPENIFVLRTKRYDKVPLIIQGPGAGIDVTADGVLRNILECN
jgi:aspartokinase/homoserine dehydrogenase 1